MGSSEPQRAPDDAHPAERLRVGVVAGVTVTKWARIWAERRPGTPLEIVPTLEADQLALLRGGSVDLAFVRLPVDREGLSLVPLYEEVPVVVVPQDHVITVVDEVSVSDLADELLLQDPDTVPAWRDLAVAHRGAPLPPVPATGSMGDTMALVAAGVGLVVVPMSVARLHHRRDLTYRPVTDLEPTRIGLAWLSDSTTPEIEDLVGIVRGRSARSSRGTLTPAQAPRADPPVRRAPAQRGGASAPARGARGDQGRRRRAR